MASTETELTENEVPPVDSPPDDWISASLSLHERRGRLVRGAVAVLLLGGLIAGVSFGWDRATAWLSSAAPVRQSLTETATRDTVRITVTEDGNLESASNVDVRCEVAGGSTILWIVEDGKQVAQGDVLVRLDQSVIQDQLNEQKIAFNKAKALKIQAEEDYAAARIAVDEYQQGTYQQELQTIEAQITVALENLRSAENLLEHTQRMTRKGFATPLQFEADKFAVKRAQLDLAAAQTAKQVLQKFTYLKMVKQLEAARDAAKAHMESEKAAFELEKSKLAQLEKELDLCTIHAPQSGMVIYANEQGRRRRSNDQAMVEEGAVVRERQSIIRLPDLSRMQVKVQVHESRVEKVQPGMPAKVTVLGQTFDGQVVSVANQPEPSSWFSANIKQYATVVSIDGTQQGLKPGMTAEVEILIEQLTDVVSVSISCVVEQDGEFFAWVDTPEGPQRRRLLLGPSNDTQIVVRDGIAAGERVLLNPRTFLEEARSSSRDAAEPAPEGGTGDQTG